MSWTDKRRSCEKNLVFKLILRVVRPYVPILLASVPNDIDIRKISSCVSSQFLYQYSLGLYLCWRHFHPLWPSWSRSILESDYGIFNPLMAYSCFLINWQFVPNCNGKWNVWPSNAILKKETRIHRVSGRVFRRGFYLSTICWPQ